MQASQLVVVNYSVRPRCLPLNSVHCLRPITCLCSSTQQDSDTIFEALNSSLQDGSEGVSFIEALASTLKAVLAAIKEYQPVITEAFGAPRVIDLIKDVSLALDDKVHVPLPVMLRHSAICYCCSHEIVLHNTLCVHIP